MYSYLCHRNKHDSIMEEKELLEAKREILEAIEKKDYEISIEEPNNVEARKRKDGSEYLYIFDMDGVKTSTTFGSYTVEIAGFTFTNDFYEGTWECSEEDLLEDDEIIEAIEGIDDVLCGQYIFPEDQATVYNRANGTDIEDYYWCEDDECPMDPDEMNSLDDFNWNSYEFEEATYYLVDDEINDADEDHDGKRWGYGAYGESDDYGKFECVILLFDENEDVVVGTMESDSMVNNDGYLD